MVFSVGLWPTTKSTATKNTRQTLAILMAMRIRWCNARCIARWSTSVASCKATRCQHWASARAILPWRPPWLTISKRIENTNKTQLLPRVLTVDQRKKATEYQDPPGTLYSGPWRNKPNPNPYATSQVEELSYILSNQT